MKIYVSGKITGLSESEVEEKFFTAKINLIKKGHFVMNPAILGQNGGFEHSDYMHICFAMIDVCDVIWMQKDWQTSKGAREELQYAVDHQKEVIYEDESTREKDFPIMYEHQKNKIDWAEIAAGGGLRAQGGEE